MKRLIILIAVISVILLSVGIIFYSKSKENNFVQVENIKANQIIQSPVSISGKAKGFWFFEASFPIKIFDANDKLLGIGIAQAQEDWMTEKFVPFLATIDFSSPETPVGYIVFQKDNPSGLVQNDAKIVLPVNFEAVPLENRIKVKAYFNNNNLDPEISCTKVFPVEREVIKTESVARSALEELLRGPKESEIKKGYSTSINSGVRIQKLTIENGVAKVDFDKQLEFQVGGSCRVGAIRSQITETLKQFSTIKEVLISINGRMEDILQP